MDCTPSGVRINAFLRWIPDYDDAAPSHQPDDRRAETAGGRPDTTLDHTERRAEMAADEHDDQGHDDQRQFHQPPRKEGRAAPPGQPGEGDQDERERELADLRAQLADRDRKFKEVNRKAAEDRKYREEREAEEARRKQAELPEIEREKKALAEAERRAADADRRAEAAAQALDELRLERQVEAEARKFNGGIGFVNPELAYKLIDRSRVDFDGDTSQWNGVREAVDKLAKDYPSLVAQKRPGPGSPPRDEFPGNTPPHRRGATHRAEPADAFQAAQAAISSTYERM
jgi:hypothetical protein